MTELKPYAEYRGSDVEWAPVLPVDWRDTRLQRIASIFAGGTPDRTNPEFWTDGSVSWLNSGSVNDGLIMTPSELITIAAATGSSTRWAHRGSVVVALAGQGKTKGMAARLEISSTFNQSMAAIVPDSQIADYRFVQLWLGANYQSLRNMAGGDLRDGLNLQHIGAIQIPLPPRQDQSTIADFLDRETAQIDAFITDQEELIGLLTERRSATISHAVTKGLDPTVPMKDSGVEWLGEVPEHWCTKRIKRFISIPVTDGPHETPDLHDEGVPFVSAEAIGSGVLNMEKIRGFISVQDDVKFARKYRPQRDDIYMVKSGATTGVVAIVDTDVVFNIWSPLAAIRCGVSAVPRFVMYALKSLPFQESVRLFWNYGTQQNIGMAILENLPIPFPVVQEQQAIATYLDHETAELDATISDAREAITLSKERRAALISAAVTGKIDVREHRAVV